MALWCLIYTIIVSHICGFDYCNYEIKVCEYKYRFQNPKVNFISAHDAQWTGYEHIAFQTVADQAAAGCDVDVPMVYCALLHHGYIRNKPVGVLSYCLRARTEAKDVIQEDTDK